MKLRAARLWISGLRTRVPRTVRAIGVISYSAAFVVWMIKPIGDPTLTVVAYGLVVVGSAISIISQGARVDRRIVWFFVATAGAGIVWVGYGLLRNNAGALSESVFFFALPMLWLFIVLGTSLSAVQTVVNTIPFVGLVIGLLGSLYYLYAIGFASLRWVTVVPLGQSAGLPGDRDYGFVLTLYSLASLTFLIPFLLISLVVPNSYSWKPSRLVAWPALLVLLLLLFVSGRRALFVSIVLAVGIGFVLFLLGKAEQRTRRRLYVATLAVLLSSAVLAVVSKFSFEAMIGSIATDLFAPGSVRARSGDSLIASFLNSPVIGHGLGATVSGSVRDKSRPWNFELQYHLLLNDLGILGFAILTAATLAVVVIGVRLYRANRVRFVLLIPMTVGTVSVLIANASNPYLHTPGQYWMFYLLVASISAAAVEKHSPGSLANPDQKDPSYAK